MKYLLIFLPILCFAQGGDSTLYGNRIDIDSFITTSCPDTCWEIKNGWMSLKPGCAQIPTFNSSGTVVNTYGLYYSGRKPKVVESFKYLGAYYELRERGN